MKQETLDKLARLDYQEEKWQIRNLKQKINEISCDGRYRVPRPLLDLLKYHKDRLAYFKRRVPMKAKEYENYLGLLYICPCCDDELFYDYVEAIEIHKRYHTYCGRCGQRLMWGDSHGEV